MKSRMNSFLLVVIIMTIMVGNLIADDLSKMSLAELYELEFKTRGDTVMSRKDRDQKVRDIDGAETRLIEGIFIKSFKKAKVRLVDQQIYQLDGAFDSGFTFRVATEKDTIRINLNPENVFYLSKWLSKEDSLTNWLKELKVASWNCWNIKIVSADFMRVSLGGKYPCWMLDIKHPEKVNFYPGWTEHPPEGIIQLVTDDKFMVVATTSKLPKPAFDMVLDCYLPVVDFQGVIDRIRIIESFLSPDWICPVQTKPGY